MWFKNIKSSTPVIIKEVEDKHEVKEQSQKSLTPGASILTKLAVGITMMYSAPISSFIGLTGTSAIATNAGFASLCSDSATSLIENNGDPKKAIEALARGQTVRNCAKSMLSAGLINEITNVVGVPATKELTDHAQKAAIKAAVDIVLSVIIDGQRLEDALKQGLTSAVISTVSSYLAGQIGANKPELGEVNHKLLHGLLGGFSGGLTSTFLGRSFKDGAVSGALGGVVSEVMAEALSPNLPQEEFSNQFMEKAQRSAKWGEFSGALSAFMLGYDTEIASLTSLNAVENNFKNRMKIILLAFTATTSAYEAYQINQTYQNEGAEAALKHLGISVMVGAAGGVAAKAVFKVGKVVYPTLKEAFNASLINKPILKSGLSKIESKLGSIEQAVHGKVIKGKEITWVDEKAVMSNKARSYNDSVLGARSNATSGNSQAPSLKYSNKDGIEKTVRFDGVEDKILIDRKLAVVRTEKAKNQALRQSEALKQNGLLGRWEVPSESELNRALKMFEELNVKNIGVKVVNIPKN